MNREKPMREQNHPVDLDDAVPVMPFQSFLLLLLAAAVGAGAALVILPDWMPGLNASLSGSAPQVFWFLSRSSAGVAYLLLWASMAIGLLVTNKLARVWPGGPAAFDLHQYFSLLGLTFALFHALILMGDRWIMFSLDRVLIPFSNPDYRPLWVGFGQVAFYLMAVVALSFYVRKRITPRVWRLLHYLSFVTYIMALGHGIFSGTDSPEMWVRIVYWLTGGSLLFLFVYRLLVTAFKQRRPATGKAPANAAHANPHPAIARRPAQDTMISSSED